MTLINRNRSNCKDVNSQKLAKLFRPPCISCGDKGRSYGPIGWPKVRLLCTIARMFKMPKSSKLIRSKSKLINTEANFTF